jgi:transcription antitermination factor NusG
VNLRTERFCWIGGRRYTVGDVVLDLRGDATPRVRVAPADGPLSWFVVQTNPNCEDRADGGLREAGFEVYAPKLSRWQKIAKPQARGPKKLEVTSPLFPGYLFLGSYGAAEPHWLSVARCDGVRRVLGVYGRARAVREAEIHEVRVLEADCYRLFRARAPSGALKEGEAVFIEDGPFTQFTARFVAMNGDDRARVLLSILGRLTEIQIPLSSLTRVA